MHVSAPFSALYRRVQYFSAPGRCVVKMHAVSGSAVKRFFKTCASVFSSSAEVASSRSRIGAPRSTARAMAMRCACPSESPPPCSVIFVFTSLGDSKTPLWFLIASSVGNIALDAVFVIVFHWGVGGVAWATFLAQGVASACAFWAVLHRLKSIETKEKPALFSGAMLRRISIVAIPSILQQSFVSVGNLCIQGLVNGFGSSAIAGYSAGVKLNTFAITSLTALSNSVSSFTGQNIGAGKMERVRSGFKAGLVMSLAVALVFMGAYVFCGENLLLLFMNSTSAEAIEIGKKFLLIVSLCYLFLALKLAADGVLRGAGAMVYFMITTFLDLILRVVLAFILVHPFGITGIWLSWPFGWVISSTLSLAFYLFGVWNPLKKKA